MRVVPWQLQCGIEACRRRVSVAAALDVFSPIRVAMPVWHSANPNSACRRNYSMHSLSTFNSGAGRSHAAEVTVASFRPPNEFDDEHRTLCNLQDRGDVSSTIYCAIVFDTWDKEVR